MVSLLLQNSGVRHREAEMFAKGVLAGILLLVTIQHHNRAYSSYTSTFRDQDIETPQAIRGGGKGPSKAEDTNTLRRELLPDWKAGEERLTIFRDKKGQAITSEFSTTSLEISLKADASQLQRATKDVTVTIPGITAKFSVPFFPARPSWLSKRTFTTNIFFCPPNGHEGTITHLIGQLLSKAGEGSFLDVGSNLGFYSLLAISMGRTAYAFDIQPVCLFNLKSLARSKDQSRLHLFNVGMSDSEQIVTNAEGGCDYENFYRENDAKDAYNAGDVKKAGIGVQVPVVRMDHWVKAMGNDLKGPIQVLKTDTEGAEGRIVMGMRETLATCLIRNWIVELTPAHWYRFGQQDNDPVATQAFVDVTEKHNFKAYFMFMQDERAPPVHMEGSVFRRLDQHPIMPGEQGTGCYNKPYYEILDMRRFIQEYCLDWADTVKRTTGSVITSARGFCGNIWFQKQGC